MELQNANPTIINVSDLPTRRRDTRRDTRSKNAPRPGHGQTTADFEAELRWDIPFASGGDTFYKMCGISKDTAISKQVDEIDPEDAGDPIDELEIFGMHPSRLPFPLSLAAPLGSTSSSSARC